MRLLVLNPNTTASMTRSIEAAARAVAAPGTEIVARTSTMGPASIEGYHDEAFAAPGVVAAVAAFMFAGADPEEVGDVSRIEAGATGEGATDETAADEGAADAAAG